jgi:hypothetical protein
MKHKYTLIKDSDNHQLVIREYGELDKDVMSLLCEESFDQKTVKAAIKEGRNALVSTLRTKNLYPPGVYAVQIAQAVEQLYNSKRKEPLDLLFDDLDVIIEKEESPPAVEEIEEEGEGLDDLLDDEVGDDFDNKIDIGKLNSSLKVADDENGAGDDGK